jgi:hydrogenase/urease accessory protein HupE
VAVALAAALLAAPAAARAHELDGASLSLSEVGSGRFSVRWHASSRTVQDDLGGAVVFPAQCRLEGGSALVCGAAGLVGAIAFPWLDGTLTRVVVDVSWRDGTRVMRVATPGSPSVKIYGGRTGGLRALAPVIADYSRLGVEHILTGFDHLLFVVALTLLVRRRRMLLATITAFTVAHSLSLALTVLGLVHVPPPPVEACIALSIVLVCAECLRPNDSLTTRAPWVVAFAFGLLHGLGFASALLDIGVPEQHVPTALLCFNVGVELGQLAIVVAVLAIRHVAARLRADRGWMRTAIIYAMGSLAAFWSLDRIRAVFGL